MPKPPAYLPPVVARHRLRNQAIAPDVTRPFWTFEAKGDDTTELSIYDEIGFSWFDEGITAAGFAKELANVSTKNLRLRINSPGGDVFDGIAIGNLLREFPGKTTVVVDALAASIASVIAVMASSSQGDELIMNPYSQFMIHDASGFSMGNAEDMREMAELLDMISNNIAQVYADRAGGDPKTWRKTMKGEKWYTAAETVEAGLADKVAENTGPREPGPDVDDLAEAIRRAYQPVALVQRPRAADAPEPPVVEPEPPVVEPEPEDEIDWSAALAGTLVSAVNSAIAPPTVDVADWRSTFATFRENAPAVPDARPRPVDLGPAPEPEPEPEPENPLVTAIRAAIDGAAVDQPEPNAPTPDAPDLGPAPPRPAPSPEPSRSPLAELIGGAVALAANDQPEPDAPVPAPADQHDDTSEIRLDVSALRRAVRESRF